MSKSNTMIGSLKLIVSLLDTKETTECQINCFSINHFSKTLDNTVIEFPLHLTDSVFNNLTDLMHLVSFFILILLHTAGKIGMYDLICILTYSLRKRAIHRNYDLWTLRKNDSNSENCLENTSYAEALFDFDDRLENRCRKFHRDHRKARVQLY